MKKIILYGDSILAAYQHNHPTPLLLARLNKMLPNANIINHSIPGATSEEALDFLPLKVTNEDYDLVVLGMGTNDCTIKLGLSPGKYSWNLDELITKIGYHKILLMGPAYTNWRIAQDHSWPRTLQFRLVAAQAAYKNKVPFLDLANDMLLTGHPNQLLQSDGIHLNDEGLDLLASALANKTKKVLQ